MSVPLSKLLDGVLNLSAIGGRNSKQLASAIISHEGLFVY